jgi:hypothetical protein
MHNRKYIVSTIPQMEEKDSRLSLLTPDSIKKALDEHTKKATRNSIGCVISSNKGNKSKKNTDEGWVKIKVEGPKDKNLKNKSYYIHNLVLYEDPKFGLIKQTVEGK